MRQYTVILFGLIFCCSNLVGNSYYRALGITTATKRVKTVPNYEESLQGREIELKIVDKVDKKTSFTQELLKYTKTKKISKNITLYGVEVGYEVSKKVKLSLDILAKLNIKDSSHLIEEERANLKIALSI